MRRLTRTLAAVLVVPCAVIPVRLASQGKAPDALSAISSEYIRVALENDQVRVLEFKAPGGAKAPMHTHAGPQVYVALKDSSRRVTFSDGKSIERSRKFGDVNWVDDPQPHAGDEIGNGTHVIIVEAKQGKWRYQ